MPNHEKIRICKIMQMLKVRPKEKYPVFFLLSTQIWQKVDQFFPLQISRVFFMSDTHFYYALSSRNFCSLK